MLLQSILPLMACQEFMRLEEQYQSAIRQWAQYASPQTLVAAGKDQLFRATSLRQEALAVRNAAATMLYVHRISCAVCKKDGMKGLSKSRIPTGPIEENSGKV